MIDAPADAAIDAPPDAPGVCDVLTQTGCGNNERCTYVSDASGLHVACEPMGTAAAGSACMVDPTSQLDNCVAGNVCAGTCKTVCSSQGSDTCPMGSVCDTYSRGSGVIGACDRECDPLNDNDFDGPGPRVKSGTVCTTQMQGCYGIPVDNGTRRTTFTCASDINYPAQMLHHRSACTVASQCAAAAGSPYLNGCNQGYLPLLTDMTGSTQVDCIALCKPLNCDAVNCGSPVGTNQIGLLPHRCNPQDALGTFNTGNNGEECTFWWMLEVDQTGTSIHHSPYSNTLGLCLDHSRYQYDSNGDGQINAADAFLPPCSSLAPGQGQGTTLGAADIGCEDSTHTNLPRRAPIRTQFSDMRILGSP